MKLSLIGVLCALVSTLAHAVEIESPLNLDKHSIDPNSIQIRFQGPAVTEKILPLVEKVLEQQGLLSNAYAWNYTTTILITTNGLSQQELGERVVRQNQGAGSHNCSTWSDAC